MFSVNKVHPSAFRRIGDRYNKYFDPHHFMGQDSFEDHMMTPAANVSKNHGEYLLEIAMPGFAKEEITIDVNENHLVVEGKKENEEVKHPQMIRQEYGHTQVSRGFELPPDALAEKIHSSYQNGVLKIFVPFAKKQPQKIEVK